MNTAPKLKQFARCLLASEAAPGEPSGVKETAVFRVCEKLRTPLGRLMGTAGFCSLFSRALTLAAAEVPWLCMLRINADGSLAGLHEPELKLHPGTVAEGETALVSQLLGLLVTFIGPALTVRLLHDAWPELDELNL